MVAAAAKGRGKDGRFAKGNAGRPKGARHKTTEAIEQLLDEDAKAITRKAVELAKGGDMVAIRLVLDRVAPPRKGRATRIRMPKVESLADVPQALSSLIAAMAAGEVSSEEAADAATVLERFVRATETADLDQRLRDLEARVGGRQ